MPGVVDGNGPNYISAHSADVILSDIRPIKLKPDALRAINVLLDEFLNSILATSRSLSTEKLRASLLNILPTSLGKEALLEAEVELRAYWERTEPKAPLEDDSRTFHLQWSFELLRIKCEAYSTLNEADESQAAEARVNEVFAKAHPHPPKSALVDPAALYLTAIIESMCEHILSNVGRVAARDSSRTYATVNDLFVALCEDDSIYGLFRLMKVYEQIESMSKAPKPRRSKSFSRSDKPSISSHPNDLTLVNTTSRSRPSTDQTATVGSTQSSRTSFDKSRAMKMFANNKSGEGEVQNGHKKSESISRSESLRQDENPNGPEDAEMLREFDDLMRSASTMKVSLTPDRLRTMEVSSIFLGRLVSCQLWTQGVQTRKRSEKHRPTSGKPNAFLFQFHAKRSPLPPPSPGRQVEAIREDEEHSFPKGRSRQASVTTPPVATPAPVRTRSVSTSGAMHTLHKQPPRSPPVKPTASYPQPSPSPNSMVQPSQYRPPPKGHDNSGFPPRTRTRGRNRDSLDLDDVMNGSDEDVAPPPQNHRINHQKSTSSVRRPGTSTSTTKVSARTQELLDFLNEGPPPEPQGPHISQSAREMVDFLSQGPPDYGASNVSLDKPQKGSGRLQRMISKLNLGNAQTEKPKVGPEAPRTPGMKPPTTPVRPTINPKPSNGTLSSLANRPIPPRPPRPISPPTTPSQDSSDENKISQTPSRRPYYDPASREPSSAERPPAPIDKPSPPPVFSVPNGRENQSPPLSKVTTSPRPPPTFVHGTSATNIYSKQVSPVSKPTSEGQQSVRSNHSHVIQNGIRKPPPAAAPPSISEPNVRDMQRLLMTAATADECRLIFDMFMARSGISREPKQQEVPYPSPSPSVAKHAPFTGSESGLETSLVELLLGGAVAADLVAELSSPQEEQKPIEGLPTTTESVEKVRPTIIHTPAHSPGGGPIRQNGTPAIRNTPSTSSLSSPSSRPLPTKPLVSTRA